MGKTNKSNRKLEIKRLLIRRRIELGIYNPKQKVLSATIEDLADPIISQLLNEFWSSGLRYGNNRKSHAKLKIKARKLERYKLNKEIEL